MNVRLSGSGAHALIVSRLPKLPLIFEVAQARGWPFILSWCHRIAGIVIVVFVWFHIYTLSSLLNPGDYDAKMKLFGFFVFAFLEWALAIPVAFHAFNGGRLILFECFGARNDEAMIRWTGGLTLLYGLLLGFFMLMGDQNVSAILFWLIMLAAGLTLLYGIASKIRRGEHAVTWKLQRLTGGLLLALVPAHLLFMHLNVAMGHEAGVVIARMQNGFVKVVDLFILLSVLYHGGYGLVSILGDYLASRLLRVPATGLIFLIMILFAWMGMRVILLI